MVSVVIPAYNVEQYIRRCLNSAIAQTYADMEIIIINDGSVDNTANICKEFELLDNRIKYYETENRGRAGARNLGIRKAQGDYITFLDADDWWDEHFVEIMVDKLKAFDAYADIAVCDIVYVDSQTGAKTESEIRMPGEKALSIADNADIINTCRTFLWGKIYKRSLFTENHLYLTPGVMEDFPLVSLLVAKSKGIVRIPYKLHYYLRNRNGNSSGNADEIRCDYVGGIAKLIDNFKTYALWDRLNEPIYKLAYSQARFALQQTIRLVKLEQAEDTAIDMLEKELITLMGKHWDKTLPFGKRFAWRGNEALKEGLKRLVITENQIVEETEDYDYMVTDVDIKHPELRGEPLYWDIADSVFYKISQK